MGFHACTGDVLFNLHHMQRYRGTMQWGYYFIQTAPQSLQYMHHHIYYLNAPSFQLIMSIYFGTTDAVEREIPLIEKVPDMIDINFTSDPRNLFFRFAFMLL